MILKWTPTTTLWKFVVSCEIAKAGYLVAGGLLNLLLSSQMPSILMRAATFIGTKASVCRPIGMHALASYCYTHASRLRNRTLCTGNADSRSQTQACSCGWMDYINVTSDVISIDMIMRSKETKLRWRVTDCLKIGTFRNPTYYYFILIII